MNIISMGESGRNTTKTLGKHKIYAQKSTKNKGFIKHKFSNNK